MLNYTHIKRKGFVQHVAKLIIKWPRQGFLNEKDRQNLMIFLNMMRMVCDSKFKILMNSVEEMIVSESSTVSQSSGDETYETQPATVHNYGGYSVEEPVQQQEIPFQPSFIGDDDEIQHEEVTEKTPVEAGTPADLIQTGLSFLDKLTQTLSSLEATQKLVSSIVQKDEKDGKTYLKIQVENEKVVENVLALFAGIFSQKKN